MRYNHFRLSALQILNWLLLSIHTQDFLLNRCCLTILRSPCRIWISSLFHKLLYYEPDKSYIQSGKYQSFYWFSVFVPELGWFPFCNSSAISLSSFICFLYYLNPYNLQLNTCKINMISCTNSSFGERDSLFATMILVLNFWQSFSNES